MRVRTPTPRANSETIAAWVSKLTKMREPRLSTANSAAITTSAAIRVDLRSKIPTTRSFPIVEIVVTVYALEPAMPCGRKTSTSAIRRKGSSEASSGV